MLDLRGIGAPIQQKGNSPVRRSKLDAIDRKILSDLQGQGRMTNVELAERAGISAPPCLRRLRSLEEDGVIVGYHAEVNAEALDYKITAFVYVKLSSNNDHDLREFEDAIRGIPLVRECYLLVGDFDFMLRVVAKTWDDYQRFISGDLTKVVHVSQIKSSLAVRRSKFAPGVPIEES
jgi:DNA-binding Lrp family transcriptional regulator